MVNLKKYDIRYDQSVSRWDEGLALGNGKMGTLVYGDGPLRLSVDRVDLWDNRPNPTTLTKEFTFKNLVRLSKSGNEADWKRRDELFEDIFTATAYPTKLTAGRITLDFGVKTKNIQTHLSLKEAVASVAIEKGSVGSAEIFLSATEFVGVARVYGDYRLDIQIPLYLSGDESGAAANNSGVGSYKEGCLRYPRAKVISEDGYTYYEQKTHTDFAFGVVALRVEFDGYSEIYYTLATNADGENFIDRAKNELAKISLIGYETLKKRHIDWWSAYWKKSEISIGVPLLEKVYYRSWYLFASCSRKGFYPMPLQGVWTADNDNLPPWKGDYHHDTNTELSYQSYLKANRMDEGRVFVDYLWNLREEYKRFAKSFFGVKGLLIPSCSTLDGKAMGGWAQYSLSPTMTIWAAQSFDEYWLYSGDKKFLRARAYPFLKAVGEAICGLLEERDGKLYLPLSSSPEIYDNTREAYLEPNSNFDLALLIYLYKTLKNYAQILGKDGDQYEVILSKLDPIALDDRGVVLLDKTQRLPESHRHFSHVMCMYPLHLLNYDREENMRIYEQTLAQIEQLGTGWWVGFSFGMCAQLYAMMHNGNAAYEKLRAFAKGFVAENGFHLNGDFKGYGFSQFHYRPFTLESSFGFCDALQEMLLQEHNGYIEAFPATSEECWQKASFKRLRSYRGVLVSAALKEGKTQKLVLETKKGVTVKVLNNFGSESLLVKINGKETTVSVAQGDVFELVLPRGKTVVSLQ
ncbi:MAG: glycoside hydrolase N-terminal domain-containing protein [Clostridia bacterium]|nr:glycoside hydrolase N-terminal domain-containing protein [Clostridia bacterium]